MSNNLPLVSIVTVVYNGRETIEQTISSILDQSYQNVEYLIIDGGSTDGTLEIINRYSDRLHYWISEKDDGIYDGMNKGLKQCKGELIGIVNSDDWLEKDAIELVVEQYLKNKNADVFHGILRFVDSTGRPRSVAGHYSSFLTTGMIEHPTCFIKRSLYLDIGYYDSSLKSAADYEFILRAYYKGAVFCFVDEILSNFREGGQSSLFIGEFEGLKVKYRFGIISFFKLCYWTIFLQIYYRLKR